MYYFIPNDPGNHESPPRKLSASMYNNIKETRQFSMETIIRDRPTFAPDNHHKTHWYENWDSFRREKKISSPKTVYIYQSSRCGGLSEIKKAVLKNFGVNYDERPMINKEDINKGDNIKNSLPRK